MNSLATLPEPTESGGIGATTSRTPIMGGLPDSPAEKTLIRRVMATRSVGQTLRPVAPYWRTKIRAAYRQMGGAFKPLNQDRRAILADAVFTTENDLEHRRPNHPQVVAMRTVRNALYDDLGWNEIPTRKKPGTTAAEQREESRRTQPC